MTTTDDATVSMLRQQLVRVHKALSRTEEKYQAERRERQRLERELAAAREDEIDSSKNQAARELVEEAMAKAAAANRECAELRSQLEQTKDAASLKRALHNLSVSFEEQENHLKTRLSEADAEIERHRETRNKCTSYTQRLAETLQEFMIMLAEEERYEASSELPQQLGGEGEEEEEEEEAEFDDNDGR